MLTCTESAAKHITLQLSASSRAMGLRIGVRKTGCSGLAYVLELCEEVRSDDRVFVSHGVSLVASERDLVFLAGTELHFARRGLGEGFEFRNPKEVAKCGCGESFTVG